MAFLLPQFKCAPSDCLIFPLFKSKGFRTFATLSATTASSLGETEELRIPSAQSHPLTQTADSFSYTRRIDSYAKMNLEATFVAESLLPSEESIIEAAAAEAFSLARAAAQVAKDVAQFVAHNPSLKHGSRQLPSQADILREEMIRHVEVDFPEKSYGNSDMLKTTSVEDLMDQTSTMGYTEIADPTENNVQMLEAQHPKGKAVRSGRRSERKARRIRAVRKASTVDLSVKCRPSGRKKRTSVQEVDYADPLHYLRGIISTTRLLSSSEELKLSLAIQDLLKLERLQEELTKRYGSEPTFSQWAAASGVDQRTLRKRLSHGVLCKDKMITSNIRLVISIAKNYQGAGLNIQDLVQEGCRGLVRGAEKFDASKGFKFSTYAHWWIKQAVRKSLSDKSRIIRLPFHMVDATYRVREARKQLYSENGKYPDNKEVAEATGLSMKRITAVMLAPKTPISLDQKIGINQDMKLSDVIADPDAESAENLLMKQFMKMDLNKVLNSLNPREEKVVRWRFGLEDGRMRTLQEIGELMGVSRERIRQIESCAFRKLKNKRRTKCLQQYLLSTS